MKHRNMSGMPLIYYLSSTTSHAKLEHDSAHRRSSRHPLEAPLMTAGQASPPKTLPVSANERHSAGWNTIIWVRWLRAGLGVPFDLLRNYRRQVAQKDRLATLRKGRRKRATEEVDPRGSGRRSSVGEGQAGLVVGSLPVFLSMSTC